jgi:hypothetical protein
MMTVRDLPTDDEVRLAMRLVLRESAEAGRRPTVTAVERRLGVAQPDLLSQLSWADRLVQAAAPGPEGGPAARDRRRAAGPGGGDRAAAARERGPAHLTRI